MRRISPRRRGAVLVLVMVILAMLSLMSFGLCHRARLDLKMGRMRSDELRAYYLALGGLRRSLMAVRQDEDGAVDHLGESWHLHTTAEAEGLLTSADEAGRAISTAMSRMHLAYAVMDEEGRLNINTSSPASWTSLPGMSDTKVHAVVDWQDADESPTRDGAESEYYQRMSEAYRAKNMPLTIMWEMALIKGFDWVSCLGEDLNGNRVLDEAEDDGPTNWPMDNADGNLDLGLLEYFTVYGNGRINLNTAGVEVLSALPDIGPAAGKAIVSWRHGPDGRPFTGDDRHLTRLAELKDVHGLSEHQTKLLQEYGTVVSAHFRIMVEASAGKQGRVRRFMAMARRSEGQVQLVWMRSLDS